MNSVSRTSGQLRGIYLGSVLHSDSIKVNLSNLPNCDDVFFQTRLFTSFNYLLVQNKDGNHYVPHFGDIRVDLLSRQVTQSFYIHFFSDKVFGIQQRLASEDYARTNYIFGVSNTENNLTYGIIDESFNEGVRFLRDLPHSNIEKIVNQVFLKLSNPNK